MLHHIFKKFSEEGNDSFLEDVSVTLIDKTDPRQIFYKEKTIEEVLLRQWYQRDWTLNIVSKIEFCFIPTSKFKPII